MGCCWPRPSRYLQIHHLYHGAPGVLTTSLGSRTNEAIASPEQILTPAQIRSVRAKKNWRPFHWSKHGRDPTSVQLGSGKSHSPRLTHLQKLSAHWSKTYPFMHLLFENDRKNVFSVAKKWDDSKVKLFSASLLCCIEFRPHVILARGQNGKTSKISQKNDHFGRDNESIWGCPILQRCLPTWELRGSSHGFQWRANHTQQSRWGKVLSGQTRLWKSTIRLQGAKYFSKWFLL